MAIPQEPSQRWLLHAVSDASACGRQFRLLNVIVDYSRKCLACIVHTSLAERRVVRQLSAVAERRLLSCTVVRDNGTELTSHTGSHGVRTPASSGIALRPATLLSLSKGRNRMAFWIRSMVVFATSA
jgi:transposase InsO family protein